MGQCPWLYYFTCTTPSVQYSTTVLDNMNQSLQVPNFRPTLFFYLIITPVSIYHSLKTVPIISICLVPNSITVMSLAYANIDLPHHGLCGTPFNISCFSSRGTRINIQEGDKSQHPSQTEYIVLNYSDRWPFILTTKHISLDIAVIQPLKMEL